MVTLVMTVRKMRERERERRRKRSLRLKMRLSLSLCRRNKRLSKHRGDVDGPKQRLRLWRISPRQGRLSLHQEKRENEAVRLRRVRRQLCLKRRQFPNQRADPRNDRR
jgi:hypothetical protein